MTKAEDRELTRICTELCELFHAGTLEKARYMELARRAEVLIGEDYEEMEPVLLYGDTEWVRELGYDR